MRYYLKENREHKKMSQREISQELNMSQQMYSFIESGSRQKKMDIMLLEKISKILGTPLEVLIGQEMEYQKVHK